MRFPYFINRAFPFTISWTWTKFVNNLYQILTSDKTMKRVVKYWNRLLVLFLGSYGNVLVSSKVYYWISPLYAFSFYLLTTGQPPCLFLVLYFDCVCYMYFAKIKCSSRIFFLLFCLSYTVLSFSIPMLHFFQAVRSYFPFHLVLFISSFLQYSKTEFVKNMFFFYVGFT